MFFSLPVLLTNQNQKLLYPKYFQTAPSPTDKAGRADIVRVEEVNVESSYAIPTRFHFYGSPGFVSGIHAGFNFKGDVY
jgi:hypothetical protein